jgi:hypothetical protein
MSLYTSVLLTYFPDAKLHKAYKKCKVKLQQLKEELSLHAEQFNDVSATGNNAHLQPFLQQVLHSHSTPLEIEIPQDLPESVMNLSDDEIHRNNRSIKKKIKQMTKCILFSDHEYLYYFEDILSLEEEITLYEKQHQELKKLQQTSPE